MPYKDLSTYYASEKMMEENQVLSMISRRIYKINQCSMATIIRTATKSELNKAQKEINKDGSCFYGRAAMQIYDKGLIWEY